MFSFWRKGTEPTYNDGDVGPGFDSHPGWHFIKALISLLSDNEPQTLFL